VAKTERAGIVTTALSPSARAFNAIAAEFDSRFSPWQSVAAQRRAVRAALLREFEPGARIFEIGGGTGQDAEFLATRGYRVLLTDSSPAMIAVARQRLMPFGSHAELASGETLEDFAGQCIAGGHGQFDGAFSNFAPLNCVENLGPVARGLARLLKPRAAAMLVLFGTACPGEIVSEILRGRAERALRRFNRGPVPARLANHEFTVVYHRASALKRAFAPWFKLERRIGIGIAVPPSSAEPWISQHPQLLAAMERFDRALCRKLAILGDHVLYQFRRTEIAIDDEEEKR